MSQWMTSASARANAGPIPGLTLPPEVSFAEYAASTVAAPQPAWRTLNIARERAFTGELRFATAPAITVFVDGGSVYFAERHGDAPLGERLLAADVVTPQQLERGVVRVGGQEHLGRLFDRDATVDRDAVMVVVESSTEALVAELAAEVVAAVEVNPYRHHQSGVHRWFVAPIDVSLSRPVSDVAQVDRSVIDDLPGLPAPTSAVRIEWDQPDVGGLAPPARAHSTAPSAPVMPADANSDATRGAAPVGASSDPFAVAGFGGAASDTGSNDPARTGSAPERPVDDAEAWLDDFQIVWPDGSEELAAPAPRRIAPAPSTATTATAGTDDAVPIVEQRDPATVEAVAAPGSAPTEASADLPTEAPIDRPADLPADANVSFAMPLLRIDTPPAPGADVPDDVPDDVADAVRRALQAIEQAATQPRPLPKIDLAPITLPELRLPTLGGSADSGTVSGGDVDVADVQPMTEYAVPPTASTPAVAAAQPHPEPRSSEPQPIDTAPRLSPAGSFAPPTPDMSAESVYERLAAEHAAAEAMAGAASRAPSPEPGQASVVFLDDEEVDSSTRKGALRRLIGSLRRGD